MQSKGYRLDFVLILVAGFNSESSLALVAATEPDDHTHFMLDLDQLLRVLCNECTQLRRLQIWINLDSTLRPRSQSLVLK